MITDDFIAVFELVKNSFDAHATKVTVTFENDRIVIQDNGKGMTYDDLVDKWLFLAYSAKNEGEEDKDLDSEKLANYRDRIQEKRLYAGAKGIGRFSCDRLGDSLTLLTRSPAEGTSIERLKVNWKDFENNPKDEFININVSHDQLPKGHIKGFNHGTIIEISNLNGESNWDRVKLRALKRSLEKLINPFDSIESDSSELSKFSIDIKCPAEIKADSREKNIKDRINGPIRNKLCSKH